MLDDHGLVGQRLRFRRIDIARKYWLDESFSIVCRSWRRICHQEYAEACSVTVSSNEAQRNLT
jgi:hypothetical protein